MERADRIYLLTFACVLGFLLAYFLTGLDPVWLPWYFPLLHHWEWVVRPGSLAMDWYGRLFWSAGGTVVAGGVTAAVVRRWKPADPNRLTRTLAMWTLLLFLFAVALFVFQLVPRHPFPAALPPGYKPR